MTTKEQERKALAQIRKIVESLGEDSYVGKAFDGCFEDAEENIENDFAMSMKDRYEAAEKKINEYKQVRDELVEENKKLEQRAKHAEELFNGKVEQASKYYESWKKAEDKAVENWNKFRMQEAKNEDLQMEIIKLKAKIYDLMEAASK